MGNDFEKRWVLSFQSIHILIILTGYSNTLCTHSCSVTCQLGPFTSITMTMYHRVLKQKVFYRPDALHVDQATALKAEIIASQMCNNNK